MPARAEFRDRDAVEVAILDALVARAEDGMTVLELRSRVDADIDRIETALNTLKDDGLIRVEHSEVEDQVWLYPHDRVVPDPGESIEEEIGVFEALRRTMLGDTADGDRSQSTYTVGGPVGRLLDRLRRFLRR